MVAVAAVVDGAEVGIAASSFTSISLTPALVAFSVANTSSTWPVLRRAEHLGLSVLASHQDRVCRQLAGPAAERFAGLEARVSERGAVTLPDAVAAVWPQAIVQTCIVHYVDYRIMLISLSQKPLAWPFPLARSA